MFSRYSCAKSRTIAAVRTTHYLSFPTIRCVKIVCLQCVTQNTATFLSARMLRLISGPHLMIPIDYLLGLRIGPGSLCSHA